MHLDGLDLNLLVSLDALLSERSVTKASERLHVSQPAMSAALQKLRFHLSDPLLERIGRQLALTPRAKTLAEPVKEILLQARLLLHTAATFDPATGRRTFRVAMSGYCAEVLGIPLVRHLSRLAPNVGCEVNELTLDALTRLNDGHTDLCIAIPQSVLFDPEYDGGELTERLLFTDTFMLAGAHENPALDADMSYEQFCEQPFIDVRINHNVISLVEQALRRQTTRPGIRVWAPSFTHAMAMASGTTLLTIVPSRLLSLHGDRLGLRAVKPPFSLERLNETAIWHPRTDLDPAHCWLRELIGTVAAEIAAAP